MIGAGYLRILEWLRGMGRLALLAKEVLFSAGGRRPSNRQLIKRQRVARHRFGCTVDSL
jgi:hypothetical protein